MSFGKRIGEILAVLAVLALIGALVWYISSDLKTRSYEKEGTLVQENEILPGDAGWDHEVCPAFVTDPEAMLYGSSQRQRSGKGI